MFVFLLYFQTADYSCSILLAVDRNCLAGSTRLHGPATLIWWIFQLTVHRTDWTYSFIMTFNLIQDSTESASQ